MSERELYTEREQTLVKHYILQHYLERFAHIIGSTWSGITYIDCFSGPWKARSEDLKDTSFSIALEELLKARDTHKKKGKLLQIRCFFLEKSTTAYAKLKKFAKDINDAEIQTKNDILENSISDIIDFINKSTLSFPFIFIDPTGWTGFAMDVIQPLLQLNQGEVLINFMTSHISRFIDSPETQTKESFERLFGSANFKDKIQGLAQEAREEAMVAEYSKNVKNVGNFNYVCSAIILHPNMDRTHFHLIYATRHPKGVEVFKDTEKRAMKLMEEARANAQQRKRTEKTKQGELFGGEVLHNPTYYDALRERYLSKSKAIVLEILQSRLRVPYDDIWAEALSVQLTWESDLKEWIKEWMENGNLKIAGLGKRKRVPQRGQNHILIWQ